MTYMFGSRFFWGSGRANHAKVLIRDVADKRTYKGVNF